MDNYKKTLILGQTSFEMRANLKDKEPKWQQFWTEKQIYQRRLEKNNGKPLFFLHDGPPYANGDLHIGHALNKILKDFIVRWKNASGYQAPFIMGWDTHGLPIETTVTKAGVDRKKLSPNEFRGLCRDYALKQVANQATQFSRLGIFSDYDIKYLTLDHSYEMSELKLFAQMFNAGLISKNLKPIYWSPSSESALADSEVEYYDVKSPTIYVTFDVVTAPTLPQPCQLLIWTTTPWTIPVNQMIAINPDLFYVVVQVANQYFVVAKSLVDKVSEAIGWKNCHIVTEVRGTELLGITYRHPLYPEKINLVVKGHHVTAESGTGLVHIAPSFGEDDFLIAKDCGQSICTPIDNQGKFTAEIGDEELVGKFYEDANKIITERLTVSGHLLKLQFLKHSYPHDWRTKKPVIYRATSQWFINLAPVKNLILGHVDKITTNPKWAKQRLYQVLEDRSDWTISRQRLWGVPIIAFYNQENALVLNAEILTHALKVLDQHGLNAWFDRPADFFLPAEYQNQQLVKEKDILDVWFDSGSSALALEARYPSFQRPYDLYLEGNDQYRGWFNASMINSVIYDDRPAYKVLISHGMTTDEKGTKMSKSLGNGLDPIAFTNDLGADMLRLWVASTDYTNDQRIGPEIIKQISESYRKIRNTIRFLLANLHDFNFQENYQTELEEVDYYVLHNLTQFKNAAAGFFENYQFNSIYTLVINYVTKDLSAFYLDFIKDILYVEFVDNRRRRQVQTVLFEQLWALLDVLRPILIHTVEEAYTCLGPSGVDEDSVHLLDNRLQDFSWNLAKVEIWDQILEFKSDVNKALEKAKVDNVVSKTLEANVYFELKPEFQKLAQSFPADLNQIFIVSNLQETAKETDFTEERMSWIKVVKNNGPKCQRCWSIYDELWQDKLCHRCYNIIQNQNLEHETLCC